MPTWIKIHLILLLFWGFIGFIFYYSKLWKSGFPLGKSGVMKLLFFYGTPIVWLLSSIIIGLMFIFFSVDARQSLFGLVLYPFAILTVYILYILINSNIFKRKEIRNDLLIQNKINECFQWTRNFKFLNDDQVSIQVYISKAKPVGHILISSVTEEQIEFIKMFHDNLPDGIMLRLIPIYSKNTGIDLSITPPH